MSEVKVLNARSGGGAATWEGGFASALGLAELDGQTFALVAGKLHEVTGTSDDGTDVAGLVRTGWLGFSSEQTKNAFKLDCFGLFSKGLKVTVERDIVGKSKEMVYNRDGRDEGTERGITVPIGHAVRGLRWRFTFENRDGGELTLREIWARVNGTWQEH